MQLSSLATACKHSPIRKFARVRLHSCNTTPTSLSTSSQELREPLDAGVQGVMQKQNMLLLNVCHAAWCPKWHCKQLLLMRQYLTCNQLSQWGLVSERFRESFACVRLLQGSSLGKKVNAVPDEICGDVLRCTSCRFVLTRCTACWLQIRPEVAMSKPFLDKKATDQLNLSVLRRLDPDTEQVSGYSHSARPSCICTKSLRLCLLLLQVLATAGHVALYVFVTEKKAWVSSKLTVRQEHFASCV